MADPALPGRVRALLDTAVDGVLPVLQAGHPVLRAPAAPYHGELDPDLLGALVETMRATMRSAPGVGLAAPQVGLGLRLVVLEDPGTSDPEVARVRERAASAFRALVNPRYEPVGEERAAFYEGCLSVAGYTAVRGRWRSVRLRGRGTVGETVDEVVTGWAARIVQHECDHLDGVLYLDAAEPRSLSAVALAAPWAGPPRPTAAADTLGFVLTGPGGAPAERPTALT